MPRASPRSALRAAPAVSIRAVLEPAVFKAYDVRGIYPDQMDEQVAYRIGRGFAQVISQLEDVNLKASGIVLHPRWGATCA